MDLSEISTLTKTSPLDKDSVGDTLLETVAVQPITEPSETSSADLNKITPPQLVAPIQTDQDEEKVEDGQNIYLGGIC